MPLKLYTYEEFHPQIEPIYQKLREEVSELFPNARIEHIGASSIPGSISKGDLDVFLGVSQDKFESVLQVLKEVGFLEKEGTFRSDELCMLVTDKFNYDVAIQVVVNGSQFESFIKFKNVLIANKDLLERYNQLKVAASEFSDDEYRRKKAVFIKEVSDLK